MKFDKQWLSLHSVLPQIKKRLDSHRIALISKRITENKNVAKEITLLLREGPVKYFDILKNGNASDVVKVASLMLPRVVTLGSLDVVAKLLEFGAKPNFALEGITSMQAAWLSLEDPKPIMDLLENKGALRLVFDNHSRDTYKLAQKGGTDWCVPCRRAFMDAVREYPNPVGSLKTLSGFDNATVREYGALLPFKALVIAVHECYDNVAVTDALFSTGVEYGDSFKHLVGNDLRRALDGDEVSKSRLAHYGKTPWFNASANATAAFLPKGKSGIDMLKAITKYFPKASPCCRISAPASKSVLDFNEYVQALKTINIDSSIVENAVTHYNEVCLPAVYNAETWKAIRPKFDYMVGILTDLALTVGCKNFDTLHKNERSVALTINPDIAKLLTGPQLVNDHPEFLAGLLQNDATMIKSEWRKNEPTLEALWLKSSPASMQIIGNVVPRELVIEALQLKAYSTDFEGYKHEEHKRKMEKVLLAVLDNQSVDIS